MLELSEARKKISIFSGVRVLLTHVAFLLTSDTPEMSFVYYLESPSPPDQLIIHSIVRDFSCLRVCQFLVEVIGGVSFELHVCE